MEQLPIIEEEKEEMISIESKVNEFYIEGNKNDDEKAFKDVTFENIKSNSFSVINGCVEDNKKIIKKSVNVINYIFIKCQMKKIIK